MQIFAKKFEATWDSIVAEEAEKEISGVRHRTGFEVK